MGDSNAGAIAEEGRAGTLSLGAGEKAGQGQTIQLRRYGCEMVQGSTGPLRRNGRWGARRSGHRQLSRRRRGGKLSTGEKSEARRRRWLQGDGNFRTVARCTSKINIQRLKFFVSYGRDYMSRTPRLCSEPVHLPLHPSATEASPHVASISARRRRQAFLVVDAIITSALYLLFMGPLAHFFSDFGRGGGAN